MISPGDFPKDRPAIGLMMTWYNDVLYDMPADFISNW